MPEIKQSIPINEIYHEEHQRKLLPRTKPNSPGRHEIATNDERTAKPASACPNPVQSPRDAHSKSVKKEEEHALLGSAFRFTSITDGPNLLLDMSEQVIGRCNRKHQKANCD